MSREQVNLEGEVWKDIANHKGYQVSNLGRVKYIGRNCAHPFGRLLSVSIKKDYLGYLSVVIRDNYYSVPRLMYRAFIGDYSSSYIIGYKDGDKFNCILSNLQLIPKIDPNKPLPELVNNSYYRIPKGELEILIDKDDYDHYDMIGFLLDSEMRGGKKRINGISVKLRENGRVPKPLHRIIMKAQPGQIVDHANRNPLDNRRCNLRFATPSQNSWNAIPNPNSASKYKGVFPERGKFKAQIAFNYIDLRLGRYDTEIEAAAAYNYAARLFHKEFAYLNDVDIPNPIVNPKILEKIKNLYERFYGEN